MLSLEWNEGNEISLTVREALASSGYLGKEGFLFEFSTDIPPTFVLMLSNPTATEIASVKTGGFRFYLADIDDLIWLSAVSENGEMEMDGPFSPGLYPEQKWPVKVLKQLLGKTLDSEFIFTMVLIDSKSSYIKAVREFKMNRHFERALSALYYEKIRQSFDSEANDATILKITSFLSPSQIATCATAECYIAARRQ
ncbi:MAG: hypothetical protein EOP07_18710 [Proteobacteria bacterium]|nr:MAG: hypothetical protein EOP07_18710 [Pseudomonadota bacterium]